MRILSLIVAAGYMILALIGAFSAPSLNTAIGSLLIVVGGLLFPLACIWFGDEMGDYVGTLPGPAINRRTPGGLVKAGGWVLLLLPVFVWVFTVMA